MNQPPDFDQLIGSDVEGAERARLRQMHVLLVQAGPPPELSPSMAAGPTLGMTMSRRTKRPRRRIMLLAATVAVLASAFVAGYVTGNGGGHGTASAQIMKLSGTPAAPAALASLQIEPVDAGGNWPMRLSVTGLPQLKDGSYYEVYLMKNGKPWAPCGSFKVATKQATVVQLNAPYHLEHGAEWVVTLQTPRSQEPGRIVMRPLV